MIPLPLIGPHAPAQSNMACAEDCLNLYVEETGDKDRPLLVSRPGLSTFGSRFTAAVTSITSAATTATVTTTANHYLVTGESVLIAGANQAEYNGTYVITRTGAATFTYTFAGSATNPATGTITWTDVNPVRALYNQERGVSTGQLFAVIGRRLYYSSSLGVLTLGPATASTTHFGGSTGPVSITDNGWQNGQQLAFCEAIGNVWVWDYNGGAPTFAAQASLTSSNTCTFFDGYILFDDRNNTGRFYRSNLYDVATVSALDFATAEGAVDGLVAIWADRREAYLFGRKTIEVWMNVGNADNPLQRFQGGFIQAGCLSPYTVARVDNSLLWLGQTETGFVGVMRLGSNYTAEVISPAWFNNEIGALAASLGQAADVLAYTMRWRGHEFYVLRLTSAGTPVKTYVYDASTRLWFLWTDAAGTGLFPALCAAYRINVLPSEDTIVGDANGQLYKLSETPTDSGVAVLRRRTLRHVANNRERMRVARLELLGENDGYSRAVTLAWSRDGARLFGAPVSVTCTNTGITKYLWSKLGAGYDWTFRLASTATNPTRWVGAFIRGPSQ